MYSSRRIFSWSKRQSGSDMYYRTGGIIAIDTSPHVSHNAAETKLTPKTDGTLSSELGTIMVEDKPFLLSPCTATYMVDAASTLQPAVHDIMHSPVPCAAAYSRPASVLKPLPSRPRSLSLPSTPDLPAELPGSILLENQGFPPYTVISEFLDVLPVSHKLHGNTHSLSQDGDDEEELSTLLNLFPNPLIHSTSIADLNYQHSEMRSTRSGNALNATTVAKPSPFRVQHPSSSNTKKGQRQSRHSLVVSPLSTGRNIATSTTTTSRNSHSFVGTQAGTTKSGRLAPLSQEDQAWTSNAENRESPQCEVGLAATPTPATTRSKHIEELKGTIATQDQTISTLQTQFASLRASHESHTASLAKTHSAEVASLKNYARALEEQLAHRPSLHHASSNNLLFLLDTTEPQTPSREEPQRLAASGFNNSDKPSQSPPEKQQCKLEDSQSNAEMESLKRKLNSTRRPETASRNLLPELNQCRQNNVALQKQFESLMAKLNESKQTERALKTLLDDSVRMCNEWQERAEDADKVSKNARALQNTIDHLENRLEIANLGRLDAEEQLCNLQKQKSPFDVGLPVLQLPPTGELQHINATHAAHLSVGTIFSSHCPTSPDIESQELSTLAAFVSRIERLQDQIRQKDLQISVLEDTKKKLRIDHEKLQGEYHVMSLQMDIQNKLLVETRHTSKHTNQLRVVIKDHEATIKEKVKSLHAIERELEHHKLLLQAQIRRQATLRLHAPVDEDPLPELGTLAARADVDRWIEKLQERLRKETPIIQDSRSRESNQVLLANLRQEIDFYVREIIYYKLDIRGYKSDIKKLNKITAQMGSHGSRVSDLDSETSSIQPAATPSRPCFGGTTPERGTPDALSAMLASPTSDMVSFNHSITPPPSGSVAAPKAMQLNDKRAFPRLKLQSPTTLQAPTRGMRPDIMTTAEHSRGPNMDTDARFLPNGMEPTPIFDDQTKCVSPSTDFSSTNPPGPPRRHGRSMSESLTPFYRLTEAPALFSYPNNEHQKLQNVRGRSSSVSEPRKDRVTPERPPRPRYGLFDSPKSRHTAVLAPPYSSDADIMDENLAHSSNCVNAPIRLLKETKRASSTPVAVSTSLLHNPALVAPAISMPPTSCSITRNAPLKVVPVTSRAGVGGTMASSKFVISPHSPIDVCGLEPPLRPTMTKPILVPPVVQTCKLGLSWKHVDQSLGPLQTSPPPRSASKGSVRTAIWLPKSREKETDAPMVRKDSISRPRLLGSPFGVAQLVK